MNEPNWGLWVEHILGIKKHRLKLIYQNDKVSFNIVQINNRTMVFEFSVNEGVRNYRTLCTNLMNDNGLKQATTFNTLGFTKNEMLFFTTGVTTPEVM